MSERATDSPTASHSVSSGNSSYRYGMSADSADSACNSVQDCVKLRDCAIGPFRPVIEADSPDGASVFNFDELPEGFFEFAQSGGETALQMHAEAITDALEQLCGSKNPPSLLRSKNAQMTAVAAKLRAAAGGPVYLADGLPFTAKNLRYEFPELRVFQLSVAEAFTESLVCPDIWVETPQFATLRSLSRMRRELRRTGVRQGLQGAAVVQALLGL